MLLSKLFIERCFQTVADTQKFSHSNFSLVAKILASSELNLHSEVEVFDAANSWLKHNSEENVASTQQNCYQKFDLVCCQNMQ